MVPGPLELAWLIITSIDYIYENKAGQSKWTAFLGAKTSSDTASQEVKHFQHFFPHIIWLHLSYLSNLKFPMLGQAAFPESASQHVGFCGYKESLHKAYLEMQYPSKSSGKHLSPMPQSNRGRKKGTDVELSWTQSSQFRSYQSEREECKKVRDLFQPRSHSLYVPANAHKNLAGLLFSGCCFHGHRGSSGLHKGNSSGCPQKAMGISINQYYYTNTAVFTAVSIFSNRPPPQNGFKRQHAGLVSSKLIWTHAQKKKKIALFLLGCKCLLSKHTHIDDKMCHRAFANVTSQGEESGLATGLL